jgi:hypothetical protein
MRRSDLRAEMLIYATLGMAVIGMALLAGRYIFRLTSTDYGSVNVPIAKFTLMPTAVATAIPATPEPTQPPQPTPTATPQPTSVIATVRTGDSWQRLVRRECYAIGVDLHPVDVAYLADVTKSHNQCWFETEFAPCQFLPAGRATLYAGDTVMVLCEG